MQVPGIRLEDYRISEKKEETSLPLTKQFHKAALRVSSRTSIEPRIKIVIEGCGQIYMVQTIGKIWLVLAIQASLLSLSLGVQNLRNKA